MKIGRGELSDRHEGEVLIPIEVNPGDGTPPFKFAVNIYDNKYFVHNSYNFHTHGGVSNYLTEAVRKRILEEAERCRSDPKQLEKVKKQTACNQFKWALFKLIKPEMTPEEIHSLVDEAIVSNIQNG